MSRLLKIISLYLLLLVSNYVYTQIDVSYLLSDLQFDLAIGNGCGQFDDQGYKECYTTGIELNDHQLDLMWVELTVGQPITNNGIEIDVLDLMVSGQLELICPVSPDYTYESTIIILDGTLSLDDPEENLELSIFPNPATTHFFIKAENLSNVICFDITGKKMFEIKNPTNLNKCYLLNYTSGVYFLRCTFENGSIINERIVIN